MIAGWSTIDTSENCNFSACRWQKQRARRISFGRSRIPDPEQSLRTEGGEAAAVHSTAEAAMRGDMRALQALWNEHRRWIAAVILAYKPQSEDLDDLLQDVAMTLVAKINTVRDQANVRAWLRTVAINAARAAGRAERARPALRLAGTEPDHECPAVEPHIELDDHARRALRLASQLPDAYREPLMLRAVHGMRSRQIAEILGVPEATIDTRISRARRMLREQAQVEDKHVACAEPALLRPA
jgi:RNA polymerase sigma-70 factor (ECF subfamily)